MAAYLETEEAKSKELWSGMWGSAKDYIGDIGNAIRNNALGCPQWDVYDVYMQGNTEGKVGFDVLGLFVGGTEINAFAKAASAERKIAAAFAKAQDEAVESARIANNFYRDGSPVAFPQEIRTSSGIVIKANPDKTATILGTYVHDTNSIINGQLSLPRSTIYDGSARPGSFNLLNTPDELYKMLGPDLFWERVNAPFIDAAIARGDDIVLATRPEPRALNRDRPDGTSERNGFGREYDYLVQKGYYYDEGSGRMVRGPK